MRIAPDYELLISRARWWHFSTKLHPVRVEVLRRGERVDHGYARDLEGAREFGASMARRNLERVREDAQLPCRIELDLTEVEA